MSDLVECILCSEFHSDVPQATFVVTECEHLFHKHCILDHLSKWSKCPNCRRQVKVSKLREIRGVNPNRTPKKFVIATLGDSAVGKTGLVNRFVNGVFENNEVSTIGADFRNVNIKVGDEPIKLFIQDCGGNFMFKAITPQYIRNAHGIIIAYDCSRYETLTSVPDWLEFANLHAPAAEKILIGCRSDLESCTCFKHSDENHCRKPTQEEIENLATSLDLFHVTTSALTAINVDIAFRTLASKIMENSYLMRNVRNNLGGGFNNGSRIKLHKPPEVEEMVSDEIVGWCGFRQLLRKFRKSGSSNNKCDVKLGKKA